MISKNNKNEKILVKKPKIYKINRNFDNKKIIKYCSNERPKDFVNCKLNLDQNKEFVNENIKNVVKHLSKYNIMFNQKELYISCSKNTINCINEKNSNLYKCQNFANDTIIDSSIDVTFKDFKNVEFLLKNYYSSFFDLTNKNKNNFDVIQNKCINIFKNRIFDLKLLLCAKTPTQCQKKLFETIILKMKHVLKFFEREDYYKLFYKIVNEFVVLDLSYLHFIKILECYFSYNKLENLV